MKKVEVYIKEAILADKHLTNEKNYLAHIPAPAIGGEVETLAKHLDLVFKYLEKIVEANGLDETIDRLIQNIILNTTKEQQETVADNIKRLFVDTIVFHDFGKVNENFQADRMLNPLFKKVSVPFKRPHAHSELGTFIYCVYQLEKLKELQLSNEETNLLAVVIFTLVNSITLHHSPNLTQPYSKLAESTFIKHYSALTKYLDLYGFKQSNLSIWCFNNFKQVIDSISFSPSQSFALYALSRLNFSLLTAADYLATSQYMSGQEIKDLGLLTPQLKEEIFKAARSSKSYNSHAYNLAESNYCIDNPTERSGDNLNVLRQNMAVAVIRSIQHNCYSRLFYLEAPTGGGKTNLSMLAVTELLKAHPEINKVFYVFPFTTLITQTHQAIIDTLGLNENEISLLHSKAGFQTKAEDDDYGSKKRDYLNNLFVHYPFCLLTHIRFFDILKTNEKETNYLLHRLANSIVVIDELQSYAPQHWDKMLYFIQEYAELFNVRFILMSATLPRIDKLKIPLSNKISFIDLLPNAASYFTNLNFSGRVQFRFDYRNQKLELNELAELVLLKSGEYLEKRKQEGVFTIVEFIFKKSATQFNELIGERLFDDVFVLSGTILEPRRKEIINFLKNKANRNRKVLLITTQVVEAGVDIDMDLGFKNVSLIDSDEQLAGRVNRNVLKEVCEVYLFQINQPSLLYKQDERYSVTRDFLSVEEHEEILATKNFKKLYDLVLEKIDKLNAIDEIQNFASDYLPAITSLDYDSVHSKFKLIDQDNISVFVPLDLAKQILSHTGEPEDVFGASELSFLSAFGVNTYGKYICGTEVWKIYKAVLLNRTKDFSEQKIDKKIMSGILSKFTFSIFANKQIRNSLERFSFPADDKENELRGFEDYIYLAHYNDCYDYQKGLIDSKFDAFENFIL